MDFEGVCGKGQSADAPLVRPSVDIRILVVDDDTTTLAIVSSILEIFDYKVETAKNPLDALATLRMQSGFFDLVLTDLHMPYMNGFELQKQVDKEFKLPVVMMTADDKENVMLESLENGIVLFLPKPVKPNDLKELWQYALRTKKGQSVMIEEIGSDPNPGPFRIVDISGDDDDNDDDDNDGDNESSKQFPHTFFSSSSSENAGSSAGDGAAGLIPRNQLGKRGNRSPPKDHGNKTGLTSSKKPCFRVENRPPGAPAGHRRRPRKPKIVWTNSLHNRFLLAIKHLSVDKAVPKKILEFMNVPGLTRENVASHLQKYRLFLKKVAKDGMEGARMLADRVLLRSSFAAGYPMQIMLQNAEKFYPPASRPSQPPTLPTTPQCQSQSQTGLAPNNNSSNNSNKNNNNISSSSTFSSRPVGISALLTDNQPAASVAQQPILCAANINCITTTATGNDVGGGVNLMQAWQQQNQATVGPFAGTTYPSSNNFGDITCASVLLNPILTVGSNLGSTALNNSAGVLINGGQIMNLAGYNQPGGGGVSNGINGGSDRVGMANGTAGINGNMNDGLGGLLGANNPPAQAPPNANAVQPPHPPPLPHRPQRSQKPRRGLANSRKGNNKSNSNDENDRLGDHMVDKNVPIFDENGLLVNQLDNLPSPNYQALIEQIPSDSSGVSSEDGNDQMSPPTNQVQNPPPLAAAPENAPNLEQPLGLQGQGNEQALLSPVGHVFPPASDGYFPLFEIPNQESHLEDIIYPFQIMNIENLHREVDWDEFMDAMLRDDCEPEWRQ